MITYRVDAAQGSRLDPMEIEDWEMADNSRGHEGLSRDTTMAAAGVFDRPVVHSETNPWAIAERLGISQFNRLPNEYDEGEFVSLSSRDFSDDAVTSPRYRVLRRNRSLDVAQRSCLDQKS